MYQIQLKFALLLLFIVVHGSINAQAPTLPKNMELVTQCLATTVKSQDKTGTCWSFSTSSFLESEVLKLTENEVDLSEMFTVRNIYLEKAQKYLRYQGTCNFGQGSLAHDVFHSYKKYGMMPESAYPGKMVDSIHNHSKLVFELKAYLDSLISSGHIEPHWKEEFSVILDRHLGSVPAVFDYEGGSYDSKSFAKEYVPVQMSDYLGITSFSHHPFNTFMVVEVPDNFSDGPYFNVPLEMMIEVINSCLKNGYSIEWDGDVSEVGFLARKGYAILSEDTSMLQKDPLKCAEIIVDQDLRQVAFDSYKTTDDHLMHITGMAKSEDNSMYYLVKNSWGNGTGLNGYLLMSEAYLSMKTVSIYINKKGLSPEIRVSLPD